MDSQALSATDILIELFYRHPKLRGCESVVEDAFALMLACFRKGGKVLVCGNGGSAADAEHIVGELMKSFRIERSVDKEFLSNYKSLFGELPPKWIEGALPAISLVSQTAFSTAFANDRTATGAFAQQVYGYGSTDDTLIAISTSGSSENVVLAAKVAKAKGLSVIALTGSDESRLSAIADCTIRDPGKDAFEVKELHLPVYHSLCAAVEAELFESR